MKNIVVFFLAWLYLLSASGIIVYQAHCSCTGNNHVTLFISPQTCEEIYLTHPLHLQRWEEVPFLANECHESSSHPKQNGCSNVSISFLKLKNEVVFKKVRTKPKLTFAAILPGVAVSLLSAASDDPKEKKIPYIGPTSAQTALDFLIPIHQLKIPYKA